jgi:hypothetical protein
MRRPEAPMGMAEGLEAQGVHGLRALRVAVDLTRPEIDRPVALSELVQRTT